MGREGAKRTDQPVGTDPAERARNGQAGRARQETARKRAGNDRPAVERILIVCPANLTFQWQRELREKFEQQFEVMRGSDIHNQFGMNQWLERPQVVTSLDLAKRQDILPGLEQVHWDLVIIDEAHRMSASDESHKSLRYRLGEKLRDSADNILLMTATPHKGDPQNFTLFLQLLDQDVYADVTSIRRAMEQNRAPFYLRRTKEAMVHFPEPRTTGAGRPGRCSPRGSPAPPTSPLRGTSLTSTTKSQSS